MRDYTRGQGIETFNMNNTANYFGSTDFVDNDNNWTSIEYNNINKDNAALDAHWGAQKTYDYFLTKHNRNSYDNNGAKIINYVHANLPEISTQFNNNDNAFWDGQRLTYGDGTYQFSPLTSVDIVAHEIGHAVTSSTANLIYNSIESGAINEGLSDVWGAMVEYYAEPTKQTYLIGEEISITFPYLRSMSNPKSRNNPDTYGGQYWVNRVNVHNNSGVFNHWFYILAEGKTGTNDLGNNYTVTGIGKEKAAKIVYRSLNSYFKATTNYAQARDLTIQATKDLYGVNSIESAIVCQAWYAVGVGNNNCNFPISILGNSVICDTSLNYTYNITNLVSGTTVHWSVSPNLSIISSSNSNIVIKVANIMSIGLATISADVSGVIKTITIWIGKPSIPEFIYGPSTVLTGALVNYSSSESQGASSYDWWLPFPYDTVNLFDYFGQNWQKLTNYSSSSSIQVFTGYAGNSGLVQVMGINECGYSGAKTIQVSHDSGGSGGGQIPIAGFTNSLTKYIIYPNPSNDLIYVELRDKNNFVEKGIIISAELFDLKGLLKSKIQIIDNSAILNVKKLLKGIYVLKIDIDGQVESHQIIVQ